MRSKEPKPSKVYTLKVTLAESKPPIWRRVQVTDTMPLSELHDVIQIAMGWQDGHLHEFEIRGQRFSARSPVGEDIFDDDSGLDETTVHLGEVIARKGQKFSYLYDFGDSWEHTIVVEAASDYEPRSIYPVCTEGVNACPPEDCGGLWGYYEMLEALKDHEQHEEYIEWIDEDFDSGAFDLGSVNKELKRMAT